MVKLLGIGAPLHDIGKLAIPKHVLEKPDVLTALEWQVMQRHTVFGAQMLMQKPSTVYRLAAQIALNHHERWDGSGYPNQLSAEDIPLTARIVAVADVFDALTEACPYKRAWSRQDAESEIIRGAGTKFDPRVVEAFARILKNRSVEMMFSKSDFALL